MQTAYISDKMRRISFWEDLEMVAHQAQGGFVCGQHAIRFLPFRAHIEYIRVQLERSGVFCIHSARTSKRFARTSILEDIGGVSFHKKTIPVQNGRTGINRGILYLDISTAADLDSSCKVFFKIALANAHILNSDIPGLFNIHSKPLDLCPIDQLKGLQDDRLRMILALNREPADQFWPLIARADLFEVLSAAKQGLTLTQD